MAKYVVAICLVAFTIAVQGFPTTDNDIASAAANGDWDKVHQLLASYYKEKFNLTPIAEADVRSLKPVPGGHVYGESEFQYHSASNENGKVKEQSGSRKIINDDGKITEFGMLPPAGLAPF